MIKRKKQLQVNSKSLQNLKNMRDNIQLLEKYQIIFNNQSYQCEVGYERFLGPEMFFHPEFIDSKWRTSIDEAIDKAIQTSPIDVRRKLYGVVSSIYIRILFYQVDLLCLMDSLQDQRDKSKPELMIDYYDILKDQEFR